MVSLSYCFRIGISYFIHTTSLRHIMTRRFILGSFASPMHGRATQMVSLKCNFIYNVPKHINVSHSHILLQTRENTVTSCRKCNGKKGSTLPKDLRLIGMKLTREPRVPTKYELMMEAQNMVPRVVHPTWRPYLGMGFSSTNNLAQGEDCSSFLDEYL